MAVIVEISIVYLLFIKVKRRGKYAISLHKNTPEHVSAPRLFFVISPDHSWRL